MKIVNHTLLALMLITGLLFGQALLASEGDPHKIVIQVSTDDPRTQTIALNNAVNLQKALGRIMSGSRLSPMAPVWGC